MQHQHVSGPAEAMLSLDPHHHSFTSVFVLGMGASSSAIRARRGGAAGLSARPMCRGERMPWHCGDWTGVLFPPGGRQGDPHGEQGDPHDARRRPRGVRGDRGERWSRRWERWSRPSLPGNPFLLFRSGFSRRRSSTRSGSHLRQPVCA